jgi:hypothetical protein
MSGLRGWTRSDIGVDVGELPDEFFALGAESAFARSSKGRHSMPA